MKILIATPCYGGSLMDGYFRSIIQLIHSSYSRGVQIDVLTISGESLITRARNNAVATFLEGDWTDLVFIDADISFEPENFWRLVDSEHEVSATPYPLKRIDWDAAAMADTGDAARRAAIDTVINFLPGTQVRRDGFARALDAGTGFMRINRVALELLVEAYPELVYEAEDGGARVALFDTVISEGRYLSEDYAFCRRWQAIGGEVMVDVVSPPLVHRGAYEFGGAS